MKYGFVILHYLTYIDTKECIESIKEKCKNNTYEIVIVDNCSNNNSVEKLEDKYSSHKNIYFIKNKVNIGFAKGNNKGYEYCKKVLKCDFIIISNNDILLECNNIFSLIEEDYKNFNCALIGPDIESLVDHQHQNPMNEEINTKRIVIKNIIKYSILYICTFGNLYEKIQKIKTSKQKVDKKVIDRNKVFLENEQLHGAFLIFTPLFIKKMDEAFCKDTFLYMEESILYRICKQKEMKTLFDSRIKVFHKEDSATNALHTVGYKKRRFIFKNIIKSLRVLYKYL